MENKDVIKKLQSYTYYCCRYAELKARLDSICPKVTPTYGNLAPSTGGIFSSKVEYIGNRRHDIQEQMNFYKMKISEVRRMIEHSGLDKVEKGVMWWIANNGKLQVYARRERIGKDNIYKIRDRAISKIIAAEKSRNVL